MVKKEKEDNAKNGFRFLSISCILLFLGLVAITSKYLVARSQWRNYSAQIQQLLTNYPKLDAQEDAMMIGRTITTVPGTNPLLQDPNQLQNYVAAISRQTKRDLVIVDKDEIILSDTVPGNIGKEYIEDKGEEVLKTISDGIPRSFIEKGVDYPQGILQTVVPLKNTSGDIIGAVILSSSTIYK